MDHSDADEPNMKVGPERVFNRLVHALDRGTLVPFLGAGVSHQTSTSEGEQPHQEPQRLAARRLLSLQGVEQRSVYDTLKGMMPKPKAGATPANVMDEDRLVDHGLAKLSEVLAMAEGYVQLCETLEIVKYVDLKPTLAHRAIAALMAEGRIAEVITTNYDTCLERAFDWVSGTKQGTTPPDSSVGTLDVVTRAREYMGRDQTGAGTSGPRQYKINGCARRYADAYAAYRVPDASEQQQEAALMALQREARRIILTERQLQSFREERWAEDLFRDRARRSHLVFSGFGSEEPQIRHTVLTLVEEYRRYDLDGTPGDPRPWERRAAPYVQARDEALSFYQTQILWGYYSAWYDLDKDPKQLHEVYPFQNAITGRDAGWYREKPGDNKLSADQFWCALLHGWWEHQFEHVWTSGRSAFYQGLVEPLLRGRSEELRRCWLTFIRRAIAILFYGGEASTAESRSRAPHCELILCTPEPPSSGASRGEVVSPLAQIFNAILARGEDKANYVVFTRMEVPVALVLLLYAWARHPRRPRVGGDRKRESVGPAVLPIEALWTASDEVWVLRDRLNLALGGADALQPEPPAPGALDEKVARILIPRSAWEAEIGWERTARRSAGRDLQIDATDLLHRALALLALEASAADGSGPLDEDALFRAMDRALVQELAHARRAAARPPSFRLELRDVAGESFHD